MYIILGETRIFLRVRNEYDNEILIKFAAHVRQRRNELNMSQLQLAELTDCHLNAIGRIERGRTDPSLLMVLRIARALKLQPKELIPELSILP